MPRSYSVSTVQLVLDAPAKWVDNVLTHHEVPGVVRGRRGLSRGLPPRALLVLGVALEVIRELQMPIGAAIALATSLCDDPTREVRVTTEITLRVDVLAIERRLERRLLEATEVAGAKRRGRPPHQRQPHV
jgi:hypothetical protein